jgi:hypothetical protein
MNNTASWSTLQSVVFSGVDLQTCLQVRVGGDIGGKKLGKKLRKRVGKRVNATVKVTVKVEDKGEVQSEYSGSKAGKKKALVKQVLILEHVDVRYRIVTETLDDLTDKPIRR